MNSNTTTPHHVGQVAKAELLIADRLEAWGLTDPNDRAAWLLQQMQDTGWKAPPDPNADRPPLIGAGAPAAVAKAALAEGREAIERKRGHRPELRAACTCRTCRPDLAIS